MIDINASDFVSTFDIKNGTVGFVGHGYVGAAVENFFKGHCDTVVYDKYSSVPEFNSLDEVVKRSEVIFVAVPTPMRKDGSCYTGIVEEVISDIKNAAKKVNRNTDSFVVVVKSTVTPGFTEEMHNKFFGMRILFSPEFLTEANSFEDFKKQNRIILGGEEEDALVVFKYFQGVSPQRVEDGRLLLLQCDPTVAEMVKLYANGILATKVMFSNEIYLICEKLGINYEEVRALACLDKRIGAGHTLVPGPDKNLGFGGHCFPKDLNNLRAFCREIGISEKVISAVIDRNNEVREDKDWERMKERAVTDK
jgi:UDPglucose 6-dehydrogenase